MHRYFCSSCSFTTDYFSQFRVHCNRIHRHDSNFKIFCNFSNGCPYVTNSIKAYKLHIQRKHGAFPVLGIPNNRPNEQNQGRCFQNINHNNRDGNGDIENENQNESQGNVNDIREHGELLACRFVINLETKHKLSQTATNSVIESTRENIKEAVLSFRSKVREELRKQHIPEEFLANIPLEDNFEVLSTQKKRNTYYRTQLGLVEPHGVVLWNERRFGPDK